MVGMADSVDGDDCLSGGGVKLRKWMIWVTTRGRYSLRVFSVAYLRVSRSSRAEGGVQIGR